MLGEIHLCCHRKRSFSNLSPVVYARGKNRCDPNTGSSPYPSSGCRNKTDSRRTDPDRADRQPKLIGCRSTCAYLLNRWQGILARIFLGKTSASHKQIQQSLQRCIGKVVAHGNRSLPRQNKGLVGSTPITGTPTRFCLQGDWCQSDIIAARFAQLSPPIRKGVVGDLFRRQYSERLNSLFVCSAKWASHFLVSPVWLYWLLRIVMGYILHILRLPHYDMPSMVRKDVVVFAVPELLSSHTVSKTLILMGDRCGKFSADKQKRNIGRIKGLKTINSGPFTIHTSTLAREKLCFFLFLHIPQGSTEMCPVYRGWSVAVDVGNTQHFYSMQHLMVFPHPPKY